MGKLDGKIAVVTGGSSGIGLATAQEFINQGAKVYITGRNQETLDTAVSQLGSKAIGVNADSSKLTDIDMLFNKVKEEDKTLDILFLNAGVAQFSPLEHTTEEQFDNMMNINFKGAYFGLQKAIPILNEGASVILTGTSAINIGMPATSAYAASKSALVSLAKTASSELVDRKIRVNVINPGPIDTPIFGKLGLPAEALDGMFKQMLEMLPMKRIGQPSEIAKVALFLASEDSSFVIGGQINADGGMSDL